MRQADNVELLPPISAPKCFGVPEGGRPAARPDVTEYLHSGTGSHGELTLPTDAASPGAPGLRAIWASPHLLRAVFSPDHHGKPARDHERDAAEPHWNHRAVERHLPTEDDAEQLEDGDQREKSNSDGGERLQR
jgi:hypothetical protein